MAKADETANASGTDDASRSGLGGATGQSALPKREDGRPQADRFRQAGREEIKSLAKAEASVVESERRVTRQTVLITELRQGGLATLEAERSLARLEAAVVEQRALRDIVLIKAREVGGTGY